MRDSMAALVSRLRTLIGDPGGDTEQFDDDELEAFLDGQRRDVRYLELDMPDLRSASVDGGTITESWSEAFAPCGDWEDSVTLRNRYEVLVTPLTEDLVTGRWTFTPYTSSAPLPITLNGSTYDLHGAAADALEAWATAAAQTAVDAESMGLKISRSQKAKALADAASSHRRRQRITQGRLVRTDEC